MTELTHKSIVEYAEAHGWEQVPTTAGMAIRLRLALGRGLGYCSVYVHFTNPALTRFDRALATVGCNVDRHLRENEVLPYLKENGR